MEDPYRTATHRWWHLSSASPELLAAEESRQLGVPGLAVDLGCGLGSELAYLAGRGWATLGVDHSPTALARAHELHPEVSFVRADVLRLPLPDAAVDLLLDRGCFHYLDAPGRARYAREAERVVRADGRLVLRMCLNSAGVPNGLDEGSIRAAFDAWQVVSMGRLQLESDTRTMPAVMAVLSRAAVARPAR